MTFDQWLDLVKQAGANLNGIDPNWVQHQFNIQMSPGQVAQAIRNGLAPGIPQAQFQHPHNQQPVQPTYYRAPQSDASKAFTFGCFGVSGGIVALILIPIIFVLLICGVCGVAFNEAASKSLNDANSRSKSSNEPSEPMGNSPTSR